MVGWHRGVWVEAVFLRVSEDVSDKDQLVPYVEFCNFIL